MVSTDRSSRQPDGRIDDAIIAASVADAARLLADEPTLQTTLDRVVELAATMVVGAEFAGVTLVNRGRLRTASASDPRVIRGDMLQRELAEGPCLHAIRESEILGVGDVERDHRWPRWGARASGELGLASMLSIRLYSSAGEHGALSLYSTAPGAFRPRDVDLASSLAAVAGAAIRAAQTEEQLQSAVRSRTTIGQAQGIIMERYSLNAAKAFRVLSRVSQETNTRLAEIAERIVETGRIPGVAGAGKTGWGGQG